MVRTKTTVSKPREKSVSSKKSSQPEERSESPTFEIKSSLTQSQISTIEKKCAEVMEDKSILTSCLEFMNTLEDYLNQDNQESFTFKTKKTIINSAYLLVNEFWQSDRKAFIGFQNDSQNKIVNTLLTAELKILLPDAITKCKLKILRSLFIYEKVWLDITNFTPDEVGQGDEVLIYQPFGGGVAAIAKGIISEISDSLVTIKDLKSFYDFYKVDKKEFEINFLKLKTKAKDLNPSRSSFVGVRRGTIDFDSSHSLFTGKKTSETLSESEKFNLDSDSDSDSDNDHAGSQISKSSTKSTKDDSNILLNNPAFLKHYNEIVEENLRLKVELAKYKQVVNKMNEMMREMVQCLNENQDIFQLSDLTIQHGDQVIVLTHKQRAEICELSEKTAQILHVCSLILKKPITELDGSEKQLLFKIIFECMGKSIERNKNKLTKYKNVFRTIKSKAKAKLEGENSNSESTVNEVEEIPKKKSKKGDNESKKKNEKNNSKKRVREEISTDSNSSTDSDN